MIPDPEAVVDAFRAGASAAGVDLSHVQVVYERVGPPHARLRLPAGAGAVYVFSLTEDYGRTCPAGPGRALKVGRVGANSGPRFMYQHYNPRAAGSTVAGSLLKSPYRWQFLGISSLTPDQVGDWIRQHTDRDHYFVSPAQPKILEMLERYVRAELGPVLEGG